MSNDSPFEQLGYFESLTDLETGKDLGTRPCELEPGRETGSRGVREIEISESFTIDRGHKKLFVKIKPGQPRRFSSIIFPLCGRMISKL